VVKLDQGRASVALPTAVVALSLAAAGCSLPFGGGPEQSAETSIEVKLANDYRLEGVEATCERPADHDVGTSFVCTTPTELGVIEWMAILGEEKTVDVQPTNLLDTGRVASIETSAAQLLSDKVGMTVVNDAFDCGEVIVLNADQTAACSVVDPASGRVYDAILQITDLGTNAFTVAVADEPR
jgi:hypothetical protein